MDCRLAIVEVQSFGDAVERRVADSSLSLYSRLVADFASNSRSCQRAVRTPGAVSVLP